MWYHKTELVPYGLCHFPFVFYALYTSALYSCFISLCPGVILSLTTSLTHSLFLSLWIIPPHPLRVRYSVDVLIYQ